MFSSRLPQTNGRNSPLGFLTIAVLGLTLTISSAAQEAGTGVTTATTVSVAAGPAPAGTVSMHAMKLDAEASLGGKVVTGAPYTATVTTTLTQTLADGTHIVQKQEASFARDSAGRTRREESLSNIGPWSTSNSSPIVFINDPVAQAHYVLEPDGKTAIKMSSQGGPMGLTGSAGIPPISDKNTFFFVARDEALPHGGPLAPPSGDRVNVMTSVMVHGAEGGADEKVQTLADQTIEGVLAHGKQITNVIPAGTIGNDQAIVVTSETWYSPDLQTIVLSKRSDPRIGESVMSLTSIQRGEPSATLFQVPAGYTLKEGGGPMVIRDDGHTAPAP